MKKLAALAVAFALACMGATAAAEVGPVRVLGNFRLGDPTNEGRGRDAPGLAVNPADPNHIVAVEQDTIAGDCLYKVTFDGGLTWTGDQLRAPAGFPAKLCNTGGGAGALDQSVAFGTGAAVYTTLSTTRSGENGRSVLLMKSADGGRTFAPGVLAAGAPGGVQSFLQPKVVVEPNPAGDRIFIAARRTTVAVGDVVVVSSRDGGATWSVPSAASGPGEAAVEHTQIVRAPDGSLYVAWRTTGMEGSLVVAKSRDAGATWTRTTAAPVTAAQGQTAHSYPSLGVDGRNGWLYVAYGQGPQQPSTQGQRTTEDHFIDAQSDILLVSSKDGAATWSRPVRLNDDPKGNNIPQRHPWVSVAPDGRVDVVWQDRRNGYRSRTDTHGASPEARMGDTYYAYSEDGGATFSPNRRITDRTFNNDIGLDYRCCAYWSYSPVAVSLDANRLLIGWIESRDGNVHNDNQDIYLATVDVRGPSTSVVSRVGDPGATPSALSVALSNRTFPGGAEAVLAGTFSTRQVTRVVVVNEAEPASALAGAVLARANLGPLLASPATGLPEEVKAEVRRMTPIGAFVIGSEASLSAGVVRDLTEAGIPGDGVVRIAGASPAEMAKLVAEAMDTRSNKDQPAFDGAMIVNPATPEAYSVASVAAARRLPVLFVEPGAVPEATAQALGGLKIPRTLAVGGPAAITDEVMAKLPSAKRLAGANAQEVSEAVAVESFALGVPRNIVYVADLADPMAGALAGSAAGRAGGLVMLTTGGSSEAAAAGVARIGFAPFVDRFIVATKARGPSSVSGAAPRPGPVAGVDTLPATGSRELTSAALALMLLALLLARTARTGR